MKKLAIWYLRKTKSSVLIGYDLQNGFVKSLNDNAYTFDNKLTNVDYRTSDDEPLLLPEGKFHITRNKKKEEPQ